MLSVLFLAALWFGLCRELSGEWSVNEQYNFGWFVPFFALYLFWLRWQDRPAAQILNPKSQIPNPAALGIAIAALLLLLPVRLFEIANPEWRLLAWIHALAVVSLTLLLLWSAGGKAWFRHFAFPIVFIFIAVPWPTAVETPVIQGLMRLVARVAAETAMLLGTPAQVEGNLIRVSNGLVGVNEACSGIRSLQTSLMIGLLFGEVKRLSLLRRLALVVCAVVIALLANFLRAVFLVRIAATENLSEVGRWHDIAGYSIIALVFVAMLGLAYLLGRSHRNSGFQPKSSGTASSLPKAQTGCPLDAAGRMPALLAAALCWLLLVEIGTATWYRLHERNLVSGIRWSVHWPEQASNFRKLKIDNEIRSVLRFDEGDAAAWTIGSSPEVGSERDADRTPQRGVPTTGPTPNTVFCSLYVFRWNPGKNSALLANLHRPDVCLPASGWKQVADHGVSIYPINGSVELPFRHFEFQRAFDGSAPQTAHAFYSLSEDRIGKPSNSHEGTDSPGMFGNRSEWTRTERLGAVLEGRRHLGQQVIEAIFMSNEPLSAAEAEARMRDLVPGVVVLRQNENR
jgi:exosortase